MVEALFFTMDQLQRRRLFLRHKNRHSDSFLINGGSENNLSPPPAPRLHIKNLED